MQRFYYNGVLFIITLFVIFVTKADGSCERFTINNKPFLTCKNINEQGLMSYFSRTYSIPNYIRIEKSSISRLDNINRDLNTLGLELMNNQIPTILPGFFQSFRRVQTLNLTRNNISVIVDGAFREMVSLQTIDLSHNEILQFNVHTFIGLTGLTHINMSFNNLNQLPDDIFFYQTHIKYLNIAHNNFTSIPKTDIVDKLDASFNQIQVMDQPYNFTFLDVSFNNISQIDVKVFRNASRLEELYLQHNSLSTMPSSIFMNLKLKVLDLSHNQFSLYEKGTSNDWLLILSPISLTKVLIDHNPWPCNALREIFLHLQIRKINTGIKNELISDNGNNILGMQCTGNNDNYIENDAISKLSDNLEYIQETITKLKESTNEINMNIINLKDDIIQINNSVIEKTTNISINDSITSSEDKNLMDVKLLLADSLVEICNDIQSENITECLAKLIEDVQQFKNSIIESNLTEIHEQIAQLKHQGHPVLVCHSNNTRTQTVLILLTVIVLISILVVLIYHIYLKRKNNIEYIKKEQINLM